MTDLFAAFLLFAVFQLKHFVADFPLQGRYMLRKFSLIPGIWIPALAAHSGVHALFTALVASWALFFSSRPMSNSAAWLLIFGVSAFDFATHFAMDRVKASPNLLGRFKDLNRPQFWWCLGLDQAVHHLVGIAIAYVLVVR